MPLLWIMKQLLRRIPTGLLCNGFTARLSRALLDGPKNSICHRVLSHVVVSCAQHRARLGDQRSVSQIHAFLCRLNLYDALARSCHQILVCNPYDFASGLYLGFSLHMTGQDAESRDCYRRFAAIDLADLDCNAVQSPEKHHGVARLRALGEALLRKEDGQESSHALLRWLHQLRASEREQLVVELQGRAPQHRPCDKQMPPSVSMPWSARRTGKRLFIWGFDFEVGPFLNELTKQGDCEVAEWFSRTRRQLIYSQTPDIVYKGASRSICDTVCRHVLAFLEVSTRTNQFQTCDVWQYLHMFHRYMEFFAQRLQSSAADCVVFANLPHVGCDLVLYHVAKALGLPTVCLYQASPERVACVYDIEDFGYFAGVPQLADVAEDEELKRDYRKSLPYMQTNRHAYKYTLGRAVADWTDHGAAAILRHLRYRTYERKIKAATGRFGADTVKGRKFVYFPLHLQPELTTSTLGGGYRDQATALEHISQFIPSDWLILVKENPKQGELMRPTAFFDRLATIPNVRLVASDADTYELMRCSEFVGTITGTAGWEAISGGKNVLVFGQPWYLTLPGVFSFQKVGSVQELLEYRIDHAELARAYTRLKSKMCSGLSVDALYISYLERFEPETNGRRLGALIHKLIESIDGRVIAECRDASKPDLAA